MFVELMKTPTTRASFGLEAPANPDPLNMQSAMQSAVQQLSMDPAKLIQANLKLWQQHMLLWQQMSASMVGTSMGAARGGTGAGRSPFQTPGLE
jgi:hypothetical protein